MCIQAASHPTNEVKDVFVIVADAQSQATIFQQSATTGYSTPIKAMDGKNIHAIAEPICNGIDFGVNHGYALFSDILSRPLIKVYGDVPPS